MSDQIVRVITSNGAVMAAAIAGRDMVEQARMIHKTYPVATAALGRTLLAASMMGNQLKGQDNSVTLQIRGGGPLGLITCVSDAEGYVRGYVQYPQSLFTPEKYQGKLDVGAAVGNDGSLTVIKDLGLKEPYVGSVPLVSGEIAEDVTSYYASSEQLPTACALGVLVDTNQSVKAAGGYLIQLLPGAAEEDIEKVERGLQKVGAVTTHLEAGMIPLELVKLALGEFELEVLETLPVGYRCNCSRERFYQKLAAIGKKDLQEIVDEGTGAEIACHFCNKTYQYSTEELEKLLENIQK